MFTCSERHTVSRVLAVATVAAWLVGALPASGVQGPLIEPVITNAVADLEADPETLSLVGANFGPSPMVFMGDGLGTLEELVVLSSTDTFIQALLASTDPGTYLLVVSTGSAPLQRTAMDVTIGAVGPEGPVGPPGPGDAHSLDAADGDPADVVFVNNEGNVGIGTTTPAAELDVNGTAFLDGFRVRHSNGTYFEYEEVAPFPDGRWKIAMDSGLTILAGRSAGAGSVVAFGKGNLKFPGNIGGTAFGSLLSQGGGGGSFLTYGLGNQPTGSTAFGLSSGGNENHLYVANDQATSNTETSTISFITNRVADLANAPNLGLNANEIIFSTGERLIPVFVASRAVRMKIDASGNVGIGTTAPEGNLHVRSGSAGTVTPSTIADELVVEGSGVGVGISILSPDASEGFLMFGSPSDNKGGQIRHHFDTSLMQFIVRGAVRLQIQDYQIKAANGIASMPSWTFLNSTGTGLFLDQANNVDLGFSTGGLERMRINDSGNVGIGTTTPVEKLHIIGNLQLGEEVDPYKSIFFHNENPGGKVQVLRLNPQNKTEIRGPVAIMLNSNATEFLDPGSGVAFGVFRPLSGEGHFIINQNGVGLTNHLETISKPSS